jgi:hypothetical protein
MIELGGNIKLKGFTELDAATLIVVKKIVGNYTKKLTQNNQDYKELLFDLNKDKENYSLTIIFQKLKSNAKGKNLFFTLSAALDNLNKK